MMTLYRLRKIRQVIIFILTNKDVSISLSKSRNSWQRNPFLTIKSFEFLQLQTHKFLYFAKLVHLTAAVGIKLDPPPVLIDKVISTPVWTNIPKKRSRLFRRE